MSNQSDPLKPSTIIDRSVLPSIHLVLVSNIKNNWVTKFAVTTFLGFCLSFLPRQKSYGNVSYLFLVSIAALSIAVILQYFSKTIIKANSHFLTVYTRFRLGSQILPISVSQIQAFEVKDTAAITGQQVAKNGEQAEDMIFVRLRNNSLILILSRLAKSESAYIKTILDKVISQQDLTLHPISEFHENLIPLELKIRRDATTLQLEKVIGSLLLFCIIAIALGAFVLHYNYNEGRIRGLFAAVVLILFVIGSVLVFALALKFKRRVILSKDQMTIIYGMLPFKKSISVAEIQAFKIEEFETTIGQRLSSFDLVYLEKNGKSGKLFSRLSKLCADQALIDIQIFLEIKK